MSQYAILVYEDPASYETMTPEGWGTVVDARLLFTAQVVEHGGFITAGGVLTPVTTALTIRAGTVTDGQFVTSKFYIRISGDGEPNRLESLHLGRKVCSCAVEGAINPGWVHG